ncbi:MAG: AAA family ATPase [Polaromonas sp.]|nr:AAA family ATPase [Polaromonas sp.]
MAKIERLVIENYRGASSRLQLEFDQTKSVALLFGENGTGKTTIADALDAIGNNSKGSLGEKSSTKARQHLPTIGKKPSDVRIEVCIAGKVWKTTLTNDTLSTVPQPNPKIRVLRRKHLQELIEAEPAKRYAALSHFIDVGKVEQSENALRDATSNVKVEFDSAVKRRTEAEAQLQSVWESEGKPSGDAMVWAKNVAAQDIAKLDEEARANQKTLEGIRSAESALINYKSALSSTTQIEGEVRAVETEVAALPGIDAQQAISLSGVLRQVSNHLQNGTHSDECPVCMQGIPIEQLKIALQTRLQDLRQFEEAKIKLDNAVHRVQVARNSVEPKCNELVAAAQGLISLIETGTMKVLVDANVDTKNFGALKENSPEDANTKSAQAEQLIALLSPLTQSLEDAAVACTKLSGQVNSVRALSGQLSTSISDTEQLEQLQISLKGAYEIVRLTRIEFTQKILDTVANECNRLYSQVHPGELIALSKLELDQARRASLNQAATFEGHADVAPQAYFSESHLDTLGFCFWLAIAKLESPNKDSVVVLDDVFTSVDAPHINRIAQLITDESQNFAHVIITTHQRLWRDIYRYAQGPGKTAQLVELQRWTLAKGISDYKTKLAVTELSDTIKNMPFDRQAAASKAGVLLEAILDYLALHFRCRVPRSPDNSYTLGELLDGTATLFKSLEIHRPKIDATGQVIVPTDYDKCSVSTIVASLRASSFVRNQAGAHYNIAGSAISDNDVSDFAALAVQLTEAVSCGTCGQIPSKKTATHYQCSCKTQPGVRMLPLQI